MKKRRNEIILIAVLLSTSFLLYSLENFIFKDSRYIYENVLSQTAFLPIYVLIVTLFIEQIIEKRDKQSMLSKLNVVIGVFFNEVGRDLLYTLSAVDNNFSNIREKMKFSADNYDKKYSELLVYLKKYESDFQCRQGGFVRLKEFMVSKKEVLLMMMENPNLMENESFTELLLALFHLYEELSKRENLDKISEQDHKHLRGDVERVYYLLMYEWLHYMKHLKEKYPYLFSLEIRVNPLDAEAKIEIG